MQVTIGNHTIEYPASPDELNLGDWIEFVRAQGLALDERAIAIDAQPNGPAMHIERMRLFLDRAYAVAAYFAGMELEQAHQELPAAQVAALYRETLPLCFLIPPDLRFITWEGVDYRLPEPILSQSSRITFGEVLDSKAMLQNNEVLKWSRWELIQHLAAIFLRPEALDYSEAMGFLDGPRVQIMLALPMRGALMISQWYEQLNGFLEQNFTIFQGSTFKPGQNMKKHFTSWGWVNFLKSVAKSKVFDITGSGLNSIEAARKARAFDVLVWASEEKEYGEAQHADHEEQMRAARHK